jgi:DNA adenine methylase
LFTKLSRAWAFYIATNMGFACHIGSWGFDKYGKRPKAFLNKKFDTTNKKLIQEVYNLMVQTKSVSAEEKLKMEKVLRSL